MKNKTLFIGCGGSGIKTLTRVNELLSGNPANRQILRENISYMVFDLDVSETENFKANVRSQVGNAGMPFIKTVQVTRNITNLEEIVRPTFDEFQSQSEDESLPEEMREQAAKKLARLKQNWWYSPDHDPDDPSRTIPSHPFRAQNITEGLNQGAGQCGPVSFLAAWNYLPNLKRDLQEAIEAIQIRNTDAQGVGLNVVIVAGTAGGTGRGCWQPIAFKVSQTLREMGFVTNPIGVFFDSSCFKNVVEGSPNERLNLSVNSLTAMSELSSWMMQPVIRTFQFALPSLKNPGTELTYPGIEPPADFSAKQKAVWYEERGLRPYTASTDVIAVPSDGDNELSPITTAYLIFGNNGIATLDNNNQYHEMAAAALYAMVAEDEFIGPGAVNRHESVRSFGAITFEVPTIPIRRYMETMVRREYGQTLYMPAAERPEDKKDRKPELEEAYCLDDEAKQLVGVKGGDYSDVEDRDLPFFVKTKFCVDDPIKTVAPITPTYKKATLVQSLMAKYAEAHFGWQPDGVSEDGVFYPTPTEGLAEALASQDEDEARSAVEEILAMNDFDEAFVDQALKEANLDDDGLKKLIQGTVLGAFAPEGVVSAVTQERMGPSVGRALAVLAKMKKRIQGSISNLGLDANGGFGVQVGDSVLIRKLDDCALRFEEEVLAPRSQKKLWEFKRYSKAKIEDLCREFQAYLTCALYFKLRKALAAKFRKALEALTEIELSLNTLVDGLKKVGDYFDTELCKSCGVKGGDIEKAYQELFVEEDESAIYKALPKMDATSNVYKRVLKPIMSRQNVEKLVRGNIDKCEKPIKECLSRFVRDLVKGEVYPTPEDAIDAIRNEFAELISANVSLKFEKNADFMTRNFSFRKVLQNNVKFWNQLLAARAGSEDIIGDIKDRLRKYLGITDFAQEDGKLRIRYDGLWEDIVTSMAGDCKPWMELKENAHETYLTAVSLVPTDSSEVDAVGLREHVKTKFHGKVLNVCLDDGKHGELIPKDRIIVYSAMAVTVRDAENPFDYIHSLEYYKEADFSRLLVKAEDEKDLASYYYPIKNNPAAKVKWGEQRDTHGYVSPIFIREPGLASTRWRPWQPWGGARSAAMERENETYDALLFAFLGSGNVSGEDRKDLASAGWKDFPLLGQGRKPESLAFQREPLDENDNRYWDKDDEFSTILTLRNYLSGKGKTGLQDKGGKALQEDQEAGNAARKVIVKELGHFRKNIAPIVGAKTVNNLVLEMQRWLNARADKATGDSAKLWADLHDRAGKFSLI